MKHRDCPDSTTDRNREQAPCRDHRPQSAPRDRRQQKTRAAIIEAFKAKTVLALKRGKGAGFSGLENSLFFRPNTRMVYGDAKATINELVGKFKES